MSVSNGFSSLKVYRSSAGSGKTFTLVKEYLKIIFASKSDFAFKEVLAITFTNKAANEMKSRIIEVLEKLSNSDTELLNIYSEETNLTRLKLIEKANQILSRILHNYSDFSVFTIDKFTHRLIRSFSQELGLSLNFNVELNEKEFLNSAVKKFLSNIGSDKQLTTYLNEFIEQSLGDSVKSNIETQLAGFQKLIFKGNRDDQLQNIKHIPLEGFSKIRKALFNELKEIEKNTFEIAEQCAGKINSEGILAEHFFYKRLPKIYAIILSKKPINLKNIESWTNWLKDDKWIGPKATSDLKQKLIDIIPFLVDNTVQIVSLSRRIIYVREILKHLTSYSLVNQLVNEVEHQKNIKGVLLISDFNRLISKIIIEEPAAFIFERIGNRYKHFLFDEFQDTSIRQWNNLVPLVHESLSRGGTNLLVGDAKQAIYRWREGDVGQFINLPKVDESLPDSFDINNLFNQYYEDYTLPVNYRSSPEIIEFNNALFSGIVNEIDEKIITNAYTNNEQGVKSKTKGYVEVKVCNKEDNLSDNKLNYMLKVIERNLLNGYNYSDIAVIVRKNKEATKVAEFLRLQRNPEIPVISGDSIVLSSSLEVQLVMNVIKAIDLNDDQSKFKVLEFLNSNDTENNIDFFFQNNENYYRQIDIKKTLNIYIPKFDFFIYNKLGLIDKLHFIISSFELNKFDPFITQLLDFLFEFSANKGSTVTGFVNYYDEESQRISVNTGRDNAVNVISIHKSKGLEFPVVIIPFGSWNDKETAVDDFDWIEGDDLKSIGLESFISPMNESSLKKLNREVLYREEKEQLFLDNINLYYVALTRAKDRLYFSIEEPKDTKSPHVKHFVSSQVTKHLCFDSEQMKLIIGEQKNLDKVNEASSVAKNSPFDLYSWKDKIHLSLDELNFKSNAVSYGILLHEVLEKITYNIDDGLSYIKSLNLKYKINKEQSLFLSKAIIELKESKELHYIFSKSNKVFNEIELVTKTGEFFRLDKLIIDAENNATVVDFKTGMAKESDQKQLLKYMDFVDESGYNVKNGVLIYLPNLKVKEIEL
jgi:ATP-dependent exoDNAse (exonuclease V) beta subunit/CRISPR/Cas system-associated exonuclease Cas4 (RecB family)